MRVEWAKGLAMNTFLAQTLCESALTDDRSRFEMTFVDAGGQFHKISIPFTIAADLIPVLEFAAADCNSQGVRTHPTAACIRGRARSC